MSTLHMNELQNHIHPVHVPYEPACKNFTIGKSFATFWNVVMWWNVTFFQN